MWWVPGGKLEDEAAGNERPAGGQQQLEELECRAAQGAGRAQVGASGWVGVPEGCGLLIPLYQQQYLHQWCDELH